MHVVSRCDGRNAIRMTWLQDDLASCLNWHQTSAHTIRNGSKSNSAFSVPLNIATAWVPRHQSEISAVRRWLSFRSASTVPHFAFYFTRASLAKCVHIGSWFHITRRRPHENLEAEGRLRSAANFGLKPTPADQPDGMYDCYRIRSGSTVGIGYATPTSRNRICATPSHATGS